MVATKLPTADGVPEINPVLVFKVSRLFRRPDLGYKFVQEEVVEAGLRAVSVSSSPRPGSPRRMRGSGG